MSARPTDGALVAPSPPAVNPEIAAGIEIQRPPLVDIKQVVASAIPNLEAICAHWLPDGKRQGHDWIARNPTRDDQNPGSFSVSLITGASIDFATGDQTHDIVSTIKHLDGLATQGEAARRVAEFLGTAPLPEPTEIRVKSAPKPMKDRPLKHPALGVPSSQWEYRDATGELLTVVCRFETIRDGKPDKEFRPLTPTPAGWLWQAPPAPRPLYGLDRLAAFPMLEREVVLCEGEKSADAAGVLLPESVTIASMNGARSPGKSDWSPLTGRVVRIWPDADQAGAKFAQEAGALIQAAGAASVSILDLSSLTASRVCIGTGPKTKRR